MALDRRLSDRRLSWQQMQALRYSLRQDESSIELPVQEGHFHIDSEM